MVSYSIEGEYAEDPLKPTHYLFYFIITEEPKYSSSGRQRAEEARYGGYNNGNELETL